MGSNTVDIFAHTSNSELIDIKSTNGHEEFISYPVGSKILITKMLHNIGGNGANTSVCFSRLGLKTAYLGKIGKDVNGKHILKELKNENIAFIGSRGEESGFSIILDSIEDDRTILGFKGCNNNLKFSEINKSKLKAKWFYLTSMLKESLVSMQKIAKHVHNNNIKIAFNPSATLLENETKTAIDLLRYSYLVVLNKEEAESLVGVNTLEVNIKKLLVFGPKIVVITDGKNGALGYKDGKYYKIMPSKNLKIVETTGAGDAFSSTLTAGLIMKKDFEFCLKMAINNAESVISYHGAQNLLLSRKKLFDIVKNDKRKIDKKKAVF